MVWIPACEGMAAFAMRKLQNRDKLKGFDLSDIDDKIMQISVEEKKEYTY
jgi:hypothetical protein